MYKILLIISTICHFQIFIHSADILPPVDGDFITDRPERKPPQDIDYYFIYKQCDHKGDSKPVRAKDYVFSKARAVRTLWNENDQYFYPNWQYESTKYKGFDDVRGIFDCTMTFKLPQHDPEVVFQELMYGSWYNMLLEADKILAKNVSETAKLLDVTNTLANPGVKELQEACKDAIKNDFDCMYLGCLIVEYNNVTLKACAWTRAMWNLGSDLKTNFFTRDHITLRLLLYGRFVGKDKNGINVRMVFPPYYPIITIDITRLYGGPCQNTYEFNCAMTGVCIYTSLTCDNMGMHNCPVYEGSTSEDTAKCSKPIETMPKLNIKSPTATQNLIVTWAVLGVLAAILGYFILNFCFWRPGYFFWRCGRLRNWCKYGNCCYKACNKSSKANCCKCCKTQGEFDTTDTILDNPLKTWAGDGFHLRENR